MSDTTDYSNMTNVAIAAAVHGDWEQAVRLNNQILNRHPQNIGCLNRIGRAYTAMGELDKALQAYEEVLALDPDNSIALKNQARLSNMNPDYANDLRGCCVDPNQFLKKPGETHIVSLVHVGAVEVVQALNSGDPLQLEARKRYIVVSDISKRNVGRLPDDVSFQLLAQIRNGRLYNACVKSATHEKVQIIISHT